MEKGWRGKDMKEYHFIATLKSFQYMTGRDQYFVEIPDDVTPSDSSYRGKPVKVILEFLEDKEPPCPKKP